jgi:hypothetical protein
LPVSAIVVIDNLIKKEGVKKKARGDGKVYRTHKEKFIENVVKKALK